MDYKTCLHQFIETFETRLKPSAKQWAEVLARVAASGGDIDDPCRCMQEYQFLLFLREAETIQLKIAEQIKLAEQRKLAGMPKEDVLAAIDLSFLKKSK